MTNIDREKLLISVIIPCFNTAKYVESCYESINSQTHKNLQIIFVNDGSSDNTEEVVKRLCERDGRVFLVSTENQGVAKARNEGLKRATGDYITFYDADDIISPEHIEHLLNVLLDNDADIAVCAFTRIKEGGAYRFDNADNGIVIYDQIGATEQLMSHRKFDVCLWNKLFDGRLIRDNDIWFIDSRYGEDNYFSYRCFSNAKRVAYSPRITYLYVMRENSLTHERFNENRLTVYNNLNAIIKDAETNRAEFIHYARYLRAAYSCEMLFYIKKHKYNKAERIAPIIEYMKEDVSHLKYCKRVALYRRLFIPLVPSVAKLLLRGVLKGKKEKTNKYKKQK